MYGVSATPYAVPPYVDEIFIRTVAIFQIMSVTTAKHTSLMAYHP